MIWGVARAGVLDLRGWVLRRSGRIAIVQPVQRRRDVPGRGRRGAGMVNTASGPCIFAPDTNWAALHNTVHQGGDGSIVFFV